MEEFEAGYVVSLTHKSQLITFSFISVVLAEQEDICKPVLWMTLGSLCLFI